MENDPVRLVQLLQQSVEVQVYDTRMFRGVCASWLRQVSQRGLEGCEECRFIGNDMLSQPRGLIVLHWINVQSVAANTLAAPPGRDCRLLWQRNISTISPVAAAPT
jgi:hypothetical protein